MTTVRAHFDGKVIVLDEPAALTPNTPLVLHIEQGSVREENAPLPGTLGAMAAALRSRLTDEEVDAMTAAIDAQFGQVEPFPDARF